MWQELQNEELRNLPSIIRNIESMSMGWAEHVARLARRGVQCSGNARGRDPLGRPRSRLVYMMFLGEVLCGGMT